MSIIGETILSVSLEMLFSKLATKGLQLFARQEQIQTDLKKWERMLVKIKAVLDDADEKQTGESLVRIWLEDLRNLAYDIEDILDEFATEALRRELLNEPDQQPNTSTSKLHKLIPTCCTKFSPGSVKFDSMMASKVAEITDRLQEITTQKDQLELKENSGGRSKRARKQPETTSLVIEAEVHGREIERKAIVDMLLKDDSSSECGLSVIPIIGMGGLGKTTLAQSVYNDKMVESHFDLKAWACVSEDFDAARITRTVLKSISPGAAFVSDDDFNSLQVKLKNGLSEKKFLLVLDDIWNENYGDWTILRRPFVAGAAGSKIIVTTRNRRVASIMHTVPSYELKKLSEDDCLIVFTQHSLGTKDFNKHQHLKEIGKEIVKKCNGLPLAAKTLGGLLRGEYAQRDWKKVLNNKIWDLPEEGSDIMRSLRVSYYYLPAHLKRCFSHCALLPKDYEFREKEIVLLWMAEGLLHSNKSGEEMEELGHNYFQELQSRSFFQQSRTDSSLFVMHDLINDLAQWAAGKIYVRMEDTMDGYKQQEFYKTLRHFSYISGFYDSIQRFGAFSDAKNLRIFLPILREYGHNVSYNVVHFLLKLQRLRVLSLRGYRIYEIPNSVGGLKHLRHLDLSETSIETLPESINMLYNLHTLLLEMCYRLKKLCTDMGNLKKLCHLDNSYTDSLEEMPLRIGKLTGLKTLYHFVVGENSGSGLQELKSLKNLKGNLRISRLENVKDVGDAIEAELNDKQNLNELSLYWSDRDLNSREPGTETQVLDMLRPHDNLKEFRIRGYGGTKFPIWLENGVLANLVTLAFYSCGCTSLASVGQLPVLKQLDVRRMQNVKSVGQEFYGNNSSMAFPSLETLTFSEMHQWEDWIHHGSGQEVQVFPQLQELSLGGCPKLIGRLPERLPSLKNLYIHECAELVVSVPFTQTLCKFSIGGCKKVVQRSDAIDLSLLNSSLVSYDSINHVFLTGELEEDHLRNIEKLRIRNSGELTYLWQNGSRLLQDISSLHRFEIEYCPQLVSLVVEEDEEDYQRQQGLLYRLQHLNLSHCQSLVKLPQALLSLCSLKEITISDCQSLESFPQALLHNNCNTPLERLCINNCDSLTYISRVPPRIKQLEVQRCRNLTTLIDESEDINNGSSGYTSLLESLYVQDCPSLISLWSKSEIPATVEFIDVGKCSKLACLSSRGNLPKALKTLRIPALSELESIAGCDKLTELEIYRNNELTEPEIYRNNELTELEIYGCELTEFEIRGCNHLTKLEINGCEKLTKLVIYGCDELTRLVIDGCDELTELEIDGCDKLKVITNFIHHLTSLRSLTILNCPSIEVFGFGFATNIVRLSIDYERIYKPMLELGGFHRFTSIRNLELSGEERCDVLSLPPEAQGMALPTSLHDLEIANFPNLQSLSSTIGEHTSLEMLSLYNCPKLQYFPENGLPASLLELNISNCPLIKERCKKDKGQYWPLIAHIPCVDLDIMYPPLVPGNLGVNQQRMV